MKRKRKYLAYMSKDADTCAIRAPKFSRDRTYPNSRLPNSRLGDGTLELRPLVLVQLLGTVWFARARHLS